MTTRLLVVFGLCALISAAPIPDLRDIEQRHITSSSLDAHVRLTRRSEREEYHQNVHLLSASEDGFHNLLVSKRNREHNTDGDKSMRASSPHKPAWGSNPHAEHKEKDHHVTQKEADSKPLYPGKVNDAFLREAGKQPHWGHRTEDKDKARKEKEDRGKKEKEEDLSCVEDECAA